MAEPADEVIAAAGGPPRKVSERRQAAARLRQVLYALPPASGRLDAPLRARLEAVADDLEGTEPSP